MSPKLSIHVEFEVHEGELMKSEYPALHVHMLDWELAAGELDAKGHAVHDPIPEDILYFPIGHAEHTPPSGPE